MATRLSKVCPKCHSTQIRKRTGGYRNFKYMCYKCNNEFHYPLVMEVERSGLHTCIKKPPSEIPHTKTKFYLTKEQILSTI